MDGTIEGCDATLGLLVEEDIKTADEGLKGIATDALLFTFSFSPSDMYQTSYFHFTWDVIIKFVHSYTMYGCEVRLR
jgi:hypothetical protein